MAKATCVDSLDEFLDATSGCEHVLFRGQSREYPAITPSLFRLSEPLDLAPLLKAADSLFLAAHKVVEEMTRIRALDDHYSRPFGDSNDDEREQAIGLFDRLTDWLGKAPFPSFYNHELEDRDDGMPNLMNLPVGSGMGVTESYSRIFAYAWSKIPDDRRSMAMLQHYGAPSGAVDVSFDRLVALWFASHVYMQEGEERAYYKRNEDAGVVYVMDAPDGYLIDLRRGEKIEFDDRTAVVPIAGMRGWRQQGGLLFGSTMDSSDLSKDVVEKIAVTPNVFDQNDDRLKMLTQQRLFPGPDDDDFYRELLSAKGSPDPHTRQLAAYVRSYILK